MALLGWPLVILLAILAVALPVTTVLVWGRLPGPRGVRTALRLALVGASQVAAVVLVAALLNDYGYFYSSWSDLLGRGSTTAQRTTALPGRAMAAAGPGAATAGDPPAASTVASLPDPGWSTKAQWATRGRVESVTISGVRSRLASHAFVYLPPEYFQAAYRHRAFPAAQVFTGFPGTDLNLLKGLDFPARQLAEVRAHRARPMVLVMMRPSVSYPRDTECTDVPAGPQALTFFAQDVPLAVATAFRVQSRGGEPSATPPAATARPSWRCCTRTRSQPPSRCRGTSTPCETAPPATSGAAPGCSRTSTTSSGVCVTCRRPRSPSW